MSVRSRTPAPDVALALRRLLLLGLLAVCALATVLSAGCELASSVAPDDDDSGADDDDAFGDDDDATSDDDDVGPDDDDDVADDDDVGPEECATTWDLPDGGVAVYVDADAAAGGDGTEGAPFATIQEGLDGARELGATHVLLAEGQYTGGGPWAIGVGDDDLTVAGCGLAETEIALEGREGFRISGPVQGVIIRDLRLSGGAGAIGLTGGAGSDVPVLLTRLAVTDSTGWAVGAWEEDTRLVVDTVGISGVLPSADGPGYGLLAWQAANVEAAFLSIESASTAGVCADSTQIQLTDTSVSNTAAVEGALGRGVHLQSGTVGTLTRVDALENRGAGVFLLATGAVTIDAGTFSNTQLSAVADGGTSGAGLVITSAITEDPGAPVEPVPVTVSGTVLSGNQQMGLLAEGFGVAVEGANLQFTANILPDEETFPVTDTGFFQNGAELALTGGDPAESLTGELVQPVFRDLLVVPSL